VEKRRQVTEDDILMTEEMIATSYRRLKKSVARAPSQVLSSAGDTVRRHPVASAAVAVGAGVALFGLFRLMTRQGAAKKNVAGSSERGYRADMTREILTMIIPLVAPYITGYLKNTMGKMFSGERD